MTRVRTQGYAAVVLLILLGGCTRSPEERRDRYIAKGKEFLAKKDYSRAILEFKNATQAMPKDAEAYYQIGLASLGSRDLRTAVVAFRKSLELNPKHPGAQLKLAEMMAGANEEKWLTDAESRLKALMQTSPVTPEMLNTLALTALKLGKTDDAVQTLERALQLAPQQLMSSIMLAKAKLSQNDIKGAEAVLKKACESAPTAAEPRVILGKFYEAQRKMAEAEAEFQRAIKLDPKNSPALLEIGNLQNSLGRKPEAEATFKRLAGLGEQSYKHVYGLFLFQEGRRDEAVREFERLASENPDDRMARTRLIAAYRAVNRVPDADKILDKALKKNPKDLDALLQRGESLLAAKKYGPAEEDLNQVLRLKPNSPEAHYILAKLHQARGAVLSYREQLSEALRLNPGMLAVRLELAQNLVAGKEAKAAAQVLDAAPGSQRELVPVIVQRNWVFWTLGDLAAMRKGIDEGLARERSADLLVQDGFWKLRSGNPSGARSSLDEALKLNPADLRAITAIKESYVMQHQSGLALEKVKEYASRQPKSAPVQEFLGTMLLAAGDRVQARAAFTAAKAADPQFVKADLSLAQLDFVENNLNSAAAKLKDVLVMNPTDITARLWLGNIEILRGNLDDALAHFQRVIDVAPENAEALNNYAYLLAEHRKQLDAALKYAQKAQELDPDNPNVADTLGWILYKKGLYPSAIKYLEHASSKGDVAAWKYHLAMAYAQVGDGQRARTSLEIALKRDPKAPEAKMASDVVAQSRK